MKDWDWKRITPFFCAIVTIIIFVYDGLAAYYGGRAATITQFFIQEGKIIPALTLCWGALIGHLYL